MPSSSIISSKAWDQFVSSVVDGVRRDWLTAIPYSWRRHDGSVVSELDLSVDATVRISLAQHFPGASIISEETGSLRPVDPTDCDHITAFVDPIDGTESLLSGQETWWTAIGLFNHGNPVAGLLYQPVRNIIHDSKRPKRSRCEEFVVGLSPNQLSGRENHTVMEQLRTRGAGLVAVPHASGKIAAVLEGRCQAGVYLPTMKSPTWKSWDLAAGVAVAASNGLILRTLNGSEVCVHPGMEPRSEVWICAADERTWAQVRAACDN